MLLLAIANNPKVANDYTFRHTSEPTSATVWKQTDRQTDRQMQSDAYEPTVHKHRCAKNERLMDVLPI